jgi:hypothetical protein
VRGIGSGVRRITPPGGSDPWGLALIVVAFVCRACGACVRDVAPGSPRRHPRCVVRLWLLGLVAAAWVLSCAGVGWLVVRRLPALSLALGTSVAGGLVGFLLANADGPAEVPAYVAAGASAGLAAGGMVGMLTTSPRPPSEPLRRAGFLVLAAAPIATAAITLLLRVACPLYVTGPGSGFCDYEDADLLGGWLSGVAVTIAFDALFVAALLLVSARRAERDDRGSGH